jgi:hypothetical protein
MRKLDVGKKRETDLLCRALDDGVNCEVGFGDLDVLLEVEQRQLQFRELLLRHRYTYHLHQKPVGR